MTWAGVRAGDLKRRITIQQRSASVDTFGQQLVTWSNLLTSWAEIQPTSGREMVSAEAQQFEISHQITIRYRSTITPAMRVLYEGRVFEIMSVLDQDTQHRRLTLMCSEGPTQG